ncbi:MAG TPA: DUF4384 domain-containing protein [Anaeromyxobacter sp.]|nr:DUF4384 domain-containing protein [Anaeromyxobacter sp.]
MTRCPSDLELERLARQPDGASAPHLGACARCAARLAELRRLSEVFEREVFLATVEAVVAGAAPRPVPRAAWVAVAMAAAVLVALGVGWLRAGRGDGALDLVARAGPAAAALADGQRIPAGAALRLEIRPRRACTLWVAAADAAGEVTRVFPPKAMTGTLGLPVAAGTTVPVDAPARPEGRRGPERYFAVCLCGDDALEWKDVDRAARAIGPGEAPLRAARGIPGLPDETLQASLLVERVER